MGNNLKTQMKERLNAAWKNSRVWVCSCVHACVCEWMPAKAWVLKILIQSISQLIVSWYYVLKENIPILSSLEWVYHPWNHMNGLSHLKTPALFHRF